MLRTTATRSLLKSLPKVAGVNTRSSYSAASPQFQNAAALRKCRLGGKHPQGLITSAPLSLRVSTTALRYASAAKPPAGKTDKRKEDRILEEKIKPDPSNVSSESSVRHVFEDSQRPEEKRDEPLAALKSDLETIKDTFSLREVPKDSMFLGLAGVLPYAATSLSTVYLAWDINHCHETGRGLLFDPETAHQLLEFITPLQVGYGAVIISFLGAIHWGLEFAGYGGRHSYRRFMHGVIAPAVAWPTIFMPVEYALITQFVAFNIMYFADTRATNRGWFPPWYSTYRFVLTFFVGASIVATLIGRGQIVSSDTKLKKPADYIKPVRDDQLEAVNREENERMKARWKAETDERSPSEEEDGNNDSDKEEDDNNDSDKKDDDNKESDKGKDDSK